MWRVGTVRTVDGAVPSKPYIASALALARRDGTLAVVVAALVGPSALVLDLTWLEAIGGALLCVPLAWRRRWPMGVLAVVAGGVPVYLALVRPSPVFIPAVLLASYTVAAHGSRRRTLRVAAGLPPYVVMIVLLFSPEPGSGSVAGQILEEMSQFGFALAVGEAVRSQRAFIAAIRDRAERGAHERELEARRRADQERVRIARDVHDLVAHSMATISTQASVGVHVGRQEPERAVEVLESIKRVSTQALQDLRQVLEVLRDPSDDGPTVPTPSLHDVPELVQQTRDSGLSVTLRMEGSQTALPSALQLAIYRIVQEALTNVMRHAGGAMATVRISVRGQEVEVDVTDDGTGAPTTSSGLGSHSGLEGMRQRATAIGGALEAGRGADGRFHVNAVLPLDRESA